MPKKTLNPPASSTCTLNELNSRLKSIDLVAHRALHMARRAYNQMELANSHRVFDEPRYGISPKLEEQRLYINTLLRIAERLEIRLGDLMPQSCSRGAGENLDVLARRRLREVGRLLAKIPLKSR